VTQTCRAGMFLFCFVFSLLLINYDDNQNNYDSNDDYDYDNDDYDYDNDDYDNEQEEEKEQVNRLETHFCVLSLKVCFFFCFLTY
jgi:hypothetical protein